MVMIDSILHCNTIETITEFTVHEDNIFLEGNTLKECGLLEIIAQTCAARIGYLGADNPVRIGVIGGVKDFEVYGVPSVGKTVKTEIKLVSEVFSAVIAEATVTCNDKTLARCEMKVFVL